MATKDLTAIFQRLVKNMSRIESCERKGALNENPKHTVKDSKTGSAGNDSPSQELYSERGSGTRA